MDVNSSSIPPDAIRVATGPYPAYFNAVEGGNASACARVQTAALAQARAFSDRHVDDDTAREAVRSLQAQLGNDAINMSACVAPGVAADDAAWGRARCWQMVYESLAGALGAGVTLPGGASNATVALASDEVR